MFKLNKHKSDRFRDKLDFIFSNLQAIQVPKGWDKLFVSLVSVETGKTITKTGKATVKNGTCRWPEAFSETISIFQEDGDSKELEGNYFKFVVAMGSSRSGVLGDITVNLADYASSKTVKSLTVLLNKCNYNSSLQLKIQCLTPKAKYRDSRSKDTNVPVEYGSPDQDDIETKSDASDGVLSRSTGSTSSNHLDSASVTRASVNRDSSLSASDSRRSFESTSSGKDTFSPRNNLVGVEHDHVERQDSIDLPNSGPSSSYRASNDDQPNYSSFLSQGPDSLEPNGHLIEPNSSGILSSSSRFGSSKDLLDAAEVTIAELRAEARMWERNAKKLAVDVDALKKELSVQSRNQETLNMELSASNQECNGLKQEIKHVKRLLEESAQKQNAEEELKLQARDKDKAQREMNEEIEFLKESNANLTEQMQKTQESNLELLTILQELEGIVETQKSEIQILKSEESTKLEFSNDASPEGIDKIKLQLEQLQEVHEELEGYMLELEKTIEEKDIEIEMERKLRMDIESKWNMKIATKEEEGLNLETKLSEAMKETLGRELEVETGSLTDLMQEIKILRSKVQELENDRDEITEENMKLHLKINTSEVINSNDANSTNSHSSDITSEVEGLTSDHLREEEIKALRQQLSILETQMSSLRDENHLLEENLEREKSVSSESLEEEKRKILNLERLSSELGKGKEEVEERLSELEKENMQLTERISALEAQLRYLTDEKEACQLELRYSKSEVINLRDEMKKLETNIEAQKIDMKQKLDDLQKRWLEAQEECEYLKLANPKLEVTAENLIEECTSLQQYNSELKRQNMELVTRYSAMESQLRDSTAKYSECSRKVEALEAEFSVMMEEFSLKEDSVKSEIDSLVNADREYKQKLMQENTSLNNMYSQKVVEVEKIQLELVHLIDQISGAQSNQVSSDTMLELSSLRTEKAKLEVSLQQLQRQFVLSDTKLCESQAKVQELTKELRASRQKQEALTAELAKVSKLLEGLKSDEPKHKINIAALEKDLKVYGHERLQLAAEISSLKEQLQRATLLQGEILTLKTSLNSATFESQKANASLDLLREEHETLKIEKESLAQEVLKMKKGLLELEEFRRSKIILEEKVLRIEGDLVAREALCVQDAELKFELNKVKRVNGELHRKIKHLEQDKEEHLKRFKSLQGKLNRKNRGIEDDANSVDDSEFDGASMATISSRGENRLLGGDDTVNTTDYKSKIEALENELAEATEANEMYKSQLKRFLSEEQKKSSNHGKLGNGVDVSALQEDFKDLRDKYFQMSLKYAEVEAQRQELILKLKATTNTKRRWF